MNKDLVEQKEQKDTNEKILHLLLSYVKRIYTSQDNIVETIKGEFKISENEDGLFYIKTEDFLQTKKVLDELPTFTNEECLDMNEKLNEREKKQQK